MLARFWAFEVDCYRPCFPKTLYFKVDSDCELIQVCKSLAMILVGCIGGFLTISWTIRVRDQDF